MNERKMKMKNLTELNSFIVKRANELEENTIKTRAFLHQHPELSSQEVETVKFLKEEVKKMGLEIEDVPNSIGFTALLDTKKAGKTLGIRTDIDALPIQENPNNLTEKKKYISKNSGAMHACGHDGHMAIVLSTIQILAELKNNLTGKIYFIFEEGEEIGSGIDAMIEHLKQKNFDAIYGNHLAAFLNSGKVAVDSGPKMAGAILVDFTVQGKSGHGSRPDLATNPVFAAAHILTSLTNAWANQLDVTKTVTLGLTQIHGGSANNVIPNEVNIEGSLRFYDMQEGRKALKVFKKVSDLTAQAHNCQIKFSEEFKVVADPVINDNKLANIAERGIEEILPQAQEKNIQWFASESFNKYQKLCPTLFSFIGIRNESLGSGAEHHNDKFDIDENALINGVLATTKFAVDFLNEEEK